MKFLPGMRHFADKPTEMNYFLSLAILCCLFVSCDPPRELYQTGTIAVNAQVINPRTTISLGDSVAFYFEVPDTVIMDGRRIKVSITNTDGATIGLTPYKIIPTHIGGSTNIPSLRTCDLYANPGNLRINETLYLSIQNGKLIGKLFMIPRQKGVYYLLQTQEGYADLNNRSLRVRFSINFGTVNRNHQLLTDSAGASNNFHLYLQDKLNQGLEVYGFNVN